MNSKDNRPQLGVPDPERQNSPIFDEGSELSLDSELESGGCHFNDTLYPLGQYVCSGSELLRCEAPGVWIREGSCEPE